MMGRWTTTLALAVGSVLAGIVLLLLASRPDSIGSHAEIIQAIAELGSVEARLDGDVLKVVSLRLSHYDSIVDSVRAIDGQRSHVDRLLAEAPYRDNPAIVDTGRRYSDQIATKIEILERLKGIAAFLRNEVTYIPFAVSRSAAGGDPAASIRLLTLSQSLMAIRTTLPDDSRAALRAALAATAGDRAKADPASLPAHMLMYLGQQERLDTTLGDYLAVGSEATLDALRARLLEQHAGEQRSAAWVSRLLSLVSAVLLITLAWACYSLVKSRIKRRYVHQVENERDQRRRIAEELAVKVEELERTRDSLVQSEKMASLGRMVAGFAHEVNTPVGVAVGAASHVGQSVESIRALLTQEEVSADDLEAHLQTIAEASDLTLANLRRAAQLVQSFKRTAVDQSSDSLREFRIAETVEDVLQSLRNVFRRSRIAIESDCPEQLRLYGPAGDLGQILTNLLMNSYVHAYDNGQTPGTIRIKVSEVRPGLIDIGYRDDGAGMEEAVYRRIFEPFFTTRRGGGGSGLGLYIVYNLVTSRLGGTISCESAPGRGTAFTLHLPARAPEAGAPAPPLDQGTAS